MPPATAVPAGTPAEDPIGAPPAGSPAAFQALVARWADAAPADAMLDRLVALQDARVAEEAGGRVRWLRPAYQATGREADASDDEIAAVTHDAPERAGITDGDTVTEESRAARPSDAVGQITAVHALAAAQPVSVDDAVRRFVGAKREIVARHFETLAILGEVQASSDGRYVAVTGAY